MHFLFLTSTCLDYVVSAECLEITSSDLDKSLSQRTWQTDMETHGKMVENWNIWVENSWKNSGKIEYSMENWRKIGVKLEYLMETCGKIAENSIFHFEQSVRMGVQTMLKYSQQFSTIFPQSGALTGLHRLIGPLCTMYFYLFSQTFSFAILDTLRYT